MNTQGNLAYTNFTYNVCRVFFEPHFEEQCRGFCGFGRGVSGSIENNVGGGGQGFQRWPSSLVGAGNIGKWGFDGFVGI